MISQEVGGVINVIEIKQVITINRRKKMHYKHIMLEAYCNKDIGRCDLFPNGINICCFEKNCREMKFIPCPNEIAYTDENGIAPAWIGFGGDMDLSQNDEQRSELITKWETICKNKIDEAYTQYMTDEL